MARRRHRGRGDVVPWDGSAALAVARRRRRPLARHAHRHRRPPPTAWTASPCSRRRCASPAATPCSGCGRSPTVAASRSSRCANESPLPIAVAFTRPDLLTGAAAGRRADRGHRRCRPGSIVVPVGHRAVGDGRARPPRADGPARCPTGSAERRRRWRAAGSRGSTRRAGSSCPTRRRCEAVRAARCEVRAVPDRRTPVDDPARFLARRRPSWCGWPSGTSATPSPCVPRRRRRRRASRRRPVAARRCGAARRRCGAGGRRRAAGARRPRAHRRPARRRAPARCRTRRASRADRGGRGPPRAPADGSSPTASRRRGAASTSRPTACVVGPASRLSLAVRWHGANVAVLWEVDGRPGGAARTGRRPTEPWHTASAGGRGACWRARAERTLGAVTWSTSLGGESRCEALAVDEPAVVERRRARRRRGGRLSTSRVELAALDASAQDLAQRRAAGSGCTRRATPAAARRSRLASIRCGSTSERGMGVEQLDDRRRCRRAGRRGAMPVSGVGSSVFGTAGRRARAPPSTPSGGRSSPCRRRPAGRARPSTARRCRPRRAARPWPRGSPRRRRRRGDGPGARRRSGVADRVACGGGCARRSRRPPRRRPAKASPASVLPAPPSRVDRQRVDGAGRQEPPHHERRHQDHGATRAQAEAAAR